MASFYTLIVTDDNEEEINNQNSYFSHRKPSQIESGFGMNYGIIKSIHFIVFINMLEFF